jgi:branched-chain amino acid transport system substrate-binding protein
MTTGISSPRRSRRRGRGDLEQIAIPPAETSFTKYFPKIPRDTEVLYHVMVGPGVLTFVKELGEFFGSSSPAIFGFIDSLEAVDISSPGLEFLEGTYFWEGMPRYAQEDQSEHDKFYRAAVGVDENGASVRIRQMCRPMRICSAAGKRSM